MNIAWPLMEGLHDLVRQPILVWSALYTGMEDRNTILKSSLRAGSHMLWTADLFVPSEEAPLQLHSTDWHNGMHLFEVIS